MVESARKHGPVDDRHPVGLKLPAPSWDLQPDVRGRLEWSAFLRRFFPNRRRHDFAALAAYEAYRNTLGPATSVYGPRTIPSRSGSAGTRRPSRRLAAAALDPGCLLSVAVLTTQLDVARCVRAALGDRDDVVVFEPLSRAAVETLLPTNQRPGNWKAVPVSPLARRRAERPPQGPARQRVTAVSSRSLSAPSR
jgi:hypothetical protein